MMIIMTIALLIGIAMLIVGLTLIGAPDSFYKFNQSIIRKVFNLNEYFNKKLFVFNSYFNNLIVNKNGTLSYRLGVALMSIIVGAGLVYSYYYYTQQGSLPPVIQTFFTNLYEHFQAYNRS